MGVIFIIGLIIILFGAFGVATEIVHAVRRGLTALEDLSFQIEGWIRRKLRKSAE